MKKQVKRKLFLGLFLITSLVVQSFSQSFTRGVQSYPTSYVSHIKIGPDGYLYTTGDYIDGLRIYQNNGSTIDYMNHYLHKAWGHEFVIDPEGTIFLTCPYYGEGLYAIEWNSSLNTIANAGLTLSGTGPRHIEQGADGTIFVLNPMVGLYALTFNGSSFTQTAFRSINDANDFDIDDNGYVYVSSDTQLKAYKYTGSSFTYQGATNLSGFECVEVAEDGTIFAANASYLYAFTFNGTYFKPMAAYNKYHIMNPGGDIAVGPDYTIFTTYYDQIRAFSYDGQYINYLTALGGSVNGRTYTGYDIAIDSDGTIFVASGDAGILSYKYSLYDRVGAYYPFYTRTLGKTFDDCSLNNNDPTYTLISHTMDARGESNRAVYFDGSDYMKVSDHPSIDLGTSDFSFSFWIKTSSTKTYNTILDKRQSYGYYVALYQGCIFLQMTDASGSYNFYKFYTYHKINDGNWHHIAITVDRNSNVAFYRDGANLNYFYSTSAQGSLNNNTFLYIGRDRNNSTYNLVGSLDEVRIFSGVLDKAEINLLANKTLLKSGATGNNAQITSEPTLPVGFEAGKIYPNPFNKSFIFPVNLPENSHITAEMYDLSGKKISTLMNNKYYNAGNLELTLQSNKLIAGEYIVKLNIQSIESDKKVFFTEKVVLTE